MRYQRDGFSIEAALRKGRDLPDWYEDRPEQLPGDDWWLEAFWDLSTDRPASQHGVAPIPWSAIVRFGQFHDMTRPEIDLLRSIIREIDAAYIDWQSEEIGKLSKRTK